MGFRISYHASDIAGGKVKEGMSDLNKSSVETQADKKVR